mgnify:CR=1 FL=1
MSKTKIGGRKRLQGEVREIRDQEWLQLHQEGKSTSAIAEEAGVSVQLVRRAIARAREQAESRIQEEADSLLGDDADFAPPSPASPRTPWWLELVPLFPIGAFTPASECPHRGPIQRGSLLCCMVCSSSGIDDHPAMKRDPATDPAPEPATTSAAVPTSATARPSRKGRFNPGASHLDRETRRERRARQFAVRSPFED